MVCNPSGLSTCRDLKDLVIAFDTGEAQLHGHCSWPNLGCISSLLHVCTGLTTGSSFSTSTQYFTIPQQKLGGQMYNPHCSTLDQIPPVFIRGGTLSPKDFPMFCHVKHGLERFPSTLPVSVWLTNMRHFDPFQLSARWRWMDGFQGPRQFIPKWIRARSMVKSSVSGDGWIVSKGGESSSQHGCRHRSRPVKVLRLGLRLRGLPLRSMGLLRCRMCWCSLGVMWKWSSGCGGWSGGYGRGVFRMWWLWVQSRGDVRGILRSW